MELTIRDIAGVSVIEAKGRIDTVTSRAFGDRLSGLIQDGVRRMVVDFSRVAYISSAGFRMLLMAGTAMEESQGQLVLSGVTGEVRRLFDIAAFTDLFVLCPAVEDGVSRVSGSPA